jgi:hypothetical protein
MRAPWTRTNNNSAYFNDCYGPGTRQEPDEHGRAHGATWNGSELKRGIWQILRHARIPGKHYHSRDDRDRELCEKLQRMRGWLPVEDLIHYMNIRSFMGFSGEDLQRLSLDTGFTERAEYRSGKYRCYQGHSFPLPDPLELHARYDEGHECWWLAGAAARSRSCSRGC